MYPEQLIRTKNDNNRNISSIDKHKNSNADEISSIPLIIPSTDENERNNHSSTKQNIDEIELSSSDDDNDQHTTLDLSNIDNSLSKSNLIVNQDTSTIISTEHMEINISSMTRLAPIEISNSSDEDLYEDASSSTHSISDNRVLIDEQTISRYISSYSYLLSNMIMFSSKDQSNIQLDSSTMKSNDDFILENHRLDHQDYHRIHNETVSSHISIEDNEQNITIPNTNGSFIADETNSNIDITKISTMNINKHNIVSDVILNRTMISSKIDETNHSSRKSK